MGGRPQYLTADMIRIKVPKILPGFYMFMLSFMQLDQAGFFPE